MRRIPRKIHIAAAMALPVFALPFTGATASAASLNGDWAPFDRCPVDNPEMLAADGTTNIALCLSSDSPDGSIKLGSTTVKTGESNLQIGLTENVASGKFSVIAPPGGSIVGAPVQVPGGLLGLMCPSNVPIVSQLCGTLTDNQLNDVVATVQSAGVPSDFNLSAGVTTGKPILTLPVKIQLQNPLLGSHCHIGSDADPVVLHPENLTLPKGAFQRFDANGTPDQARGVLFRIALTGATQGDSSFAVPGASGCGLAGLLNGAIDLKEGLPSPNGKNNLVLNGSSTYLAGLNSPSLAAPNDGKDLSADWHSAQRP